MSVRSEEDRDEGRQTRLEELCWSDALGGRWFACGRMISSTGRSGTSSAGDGFNSAGSNINSFNELLSNELLRFADFISHLERAMQAINKQVDISFRRLIRRDFIN